MQVRPLFRNAVASAALTAATLGLIGCVGDVAVGGDDGPYYYGDGGWLYGAGYYHNHGDWSGGGHPGFHGGWGHGGSGHSGGGGHAGGGGGHSGGGGSHH
jgi:hypothetical protein